MPGRVPVAPGDPCVRLDEFEQHAADLLPREGEIARTTTRDEVFVDLAISALTRGGRRRGPVADLDRIERFNEEHSDRATAGGDRRDRTAADKRRGDRARRRRDPGLPDRGVRTPVDDARPARGGRGGPARG